MSTTTKAEHTAGAVKAWKELADLWPETSIRHFPESVATLIDKCTAAPEMLEALEHIIHRLSPSGNDLTIRRAIAIAEAAIRKAKGETA